MLPEFSLLFNSWPKTVLRKDLLRTHDSLIYMRNSDMDQTGREGRTWEKECDSKIWRVIDSKSQYFWCSSCVPFYERILAKYLILVFLILMCFFSSYTTIFETTYLHCGLLILPKSWHFLLAYSFFIEKTCFLWKFYTVNIVIYILSPGIYMSVKQKVPLISSSGCSTLTILSKFQTILLSF